MLKRYFWLAHVFLVTLAAVFAADIARSYISAKLAMPIAPKPTQTRRVSRRPTRAGFTDYEIIVKRNIFNANPPQDGKGAGPDLSPVRPPTTPTELQLKLAGTAAGVPNRRYAIIEDLRNRGSQAVYEVGDMVQSARIIEIHPECVVLDKGGQAESLCFQYDTDKRQVARHRPSVPPPRPSASGDNTGIVRVDAATWRVSRELILEQFSSLGGLAQQARVLPYIVRGQQQGFRLTRLKGGSLLQRIGLHNGDVLQKINGLNIASAEEALQAFQQLRNESTVRLEILRRNRPTTLTYEIR